MVKVGLEHLNEPHRSLVKKMLDLLIKVFSDRLVSLVVYGSVARGYSRPDSDVDLLIVIKNLPKSRLERVRQFISVEDMLKSELNTLYEKGYNITFSPILKTPDEARTISPIYLDMVEDAIIIYDVKGFFKEILDRLALRLKELNAERVWIGKKWYWRLKKEFKPGEVIIIE
jgi:hypothetical protein